MSKEQIMEIRHIMEPEQRQQIARTILEALPDWFGIDEAREQYIRESAEQRFLAAFNEEEPIGFLCLKETGKVTIELAVMGVRKPYHRQGIGRQLVMEAKQIARENGYHFFQVKTVQMGKYPDYDQTNLFYLSLGFQEFEVFPALWDENNPCQVYVMSLRC